MGEKEKDENKKPDEESTIAKEDTMGENNVENVEKPLQADKKDKNDELDKSKRVSGQGMPRPMTPKSKKFHNIRAISTPQVNKTVMGDNVTFMSESAMDLSAITVLSPPSTLNDPDSRR